MRRRPLPVDHSAVRFVGALPSSAVVPPEAPSCPYRRRSVFVAALTSLVLACATVVAVLASPVAQAADSRDSFVTRCGIRFCLDGRAFYFAGTNTYDVFTFGFDWLPGEQYVDKPRIDAHMARLQADGVTVLRLWMFSHEDWQGFEAQEGVYTEEEFILFDYVMKSARDHFIRLIPVFENYWEAYGGIDKRLPWEGLPGGQANRWRFFNRQQCPGCFTQYKNYVQYALSRTNFFTGVRWINDPTVLAWELMNEPRYQDATPNENTTGTTLRAWVDEMGQFVKSLDPQPPARHRPGGPADRVRLRRRRRQPVRLHPPVPVHRLRLRPHVPDRGLGRASNFASARALLRRWISDAHNRGRQAVRARRVERPRQQDPVVAGDLRRDGGQRRRRRRVLVVPGQLQLRRLRQRPGLPRARRLPPALGQHAGQERRDRPDHDAHRDHDPAAHHDHAAGHHHHPAAHDHDPAAHHDDAAADHHDPAADHDQPPPGGCTAYLQVVGSWGDGYQGEFTVLNTGTTTTNGWSVSLTLPSGQSINNMWGGIRSAELGHDHRHARVVERPARPERDRRLRLHRELSGSNGRTDQRHLHDDLTLPAPGPTSRRS